MSNISDEAKKYDCFISHASEDKPDFVEALVNNLESKGIKVWYDAHIMNIGDSLRESIDKGLKNSLCGVVVLSKNFFAKQWTDYELNGLVARQNSDGKKTILPIWHNVTVEEVRQYSLSLSDIFAGDSSSGVETVARSIIKTINNLKSTENQVEEENYSDVGKESSALIEKYENDNSHNIQTKDAKQIIEDLILDDKNIIRVHKFINGQAEELINTLTDDFSNLAKIQQPLYNTFYERTLAYDSYCEKILSIIITGAYWGSEKYNNLWINLFKRFANLKVIESGYTSLIDFQKYPSLLIYYVLLIIELIKEDYEMLYKIFHGFDINDYNTNNSTEPIGIYNPNNIVRPEVFNNILQQRYKTPINDHLHDVLRPLFADIIPDDNEFANIFDRVEYFIGLEFSNVRLDSSYGFWAPTGRFLWRYSNFYGIDSDYTSKLHPAKFIDKLVQQGTVFSYNLLGKTEERYHKISEKYTEFIKRINFY